MACCKEDGMKLTGFVGKRALVTGGNRGIGLGIAEALYKAGAHVIITGRNQELLDSTKTKMPNIETLKFDLTNWQETQNAVKSVLPIDMLVNNAGLCIKKPFGEFEEGDFDSVISVNTKSVLNISQVVANDLKSRNMGGVIVNVSSVSSKSPSQSNSIYCASKFGLDGLSACMTLELGPHGIRVHTIHPTVVMTDMGRQFWSDPAKQEAVLKKLPVGRFPEVSEVANAAMFLLSDQAAYLDGVAIPIDGGFLRTK